MANAPLQFRKAERFKAKLRIGLFGPSGSGKTRSALRLARGIAGNWEDICVIDTENGSADLYSHLGGYNVITLAPPYTPEKYVDAMEMAIKNGAKVVIIDSITHEWSGTGGILEDADRLSATMRDGRQVWTKLTPRHNRFIDSIILSPVHTISCGRSKQEIVMTEKESNGRTVKVPEKMGMKAITREGFEYEMTVSFDLAINHYAISSKDRTNDEQGRPIFQDQPPRMLEEKDGETLMEWAKSGVDQPPPPPMASMGQKRVLIEYAKATVKDKDALVRAIAYINDNMTWKEAYERMVKYNLLTEEPTKEELEAAGITPPAKPAESKVEQPAPEAPSAGSPENGALTAPPSGMTASMLPMDVPTSSAPGPARDPAAPPIKSTGLEHVTDH